MAGAIARLPDRAQPRLLTHGDMVRNRYGAGGARMEASTNFPHVIKCGLPMLRDRRARNYPEEICRLDALLSLMAELDDTCVLYRGGVEALSVVKAGAQAVLDAGGYGNANGRQRLRALDRELIARHVSPGGSADLLAATIFLDALEYQQDEVLKDRSHRGREMELLEFDYPSATRRVTRKAHVGVVGSGDMEVLMEPAEKEGAHVSIRTSVNGFGSSWKAVLDRFFCQV